MLRLLEGLVHCACTSEELFFFPLNEIEQFLDYESTVAVKCCMPTYQFDNLVFETLKQNVLTILSLQKRTYTTQ